VHERAAAAGHEVEEPAIALQVALVVVDVAADGRDVVVGLVADDRVDGRELVALDRAGALLAVDP
jgi:hypothetical protein